MCRQSSAQLPNIKFHDNPFGDSRVVAFRVDGRTANQLAIRAYISEQMHFAPLVADAQIIV
jgi:hypothetical protein